MGQYDSVFDMSAEEENEFDTVFDQEDSLIDSVVGCNENGDPLTGVDFDDLHQEEDDATHDDFEDDLQKEEEMGAPNPEGTDDIDKVLDDNSVSDHPATDGVDPDPDVTDVINAAFGECGDEDDGSALIDDDEIASESSDIDDISDDIEDVDDSDIDEVLDSPNESADDLDYDSSDEDLIDIAINGGE